MARLLSQVFESTQATMQCLHSTVSKIHSASEKGSLTRGIDTLDVVQAMLYVGMFLVMLAVAFVVYVEIHDRRAARIRNSSTVPYAYAQETETQTRNLKGNR